MWYVVKAREGAELRVGLRPDVTPESFRDHRRWHVENCLERVAVRTGDAVLFPRDRAYDLPRSRAV